MAEPTPAIRVEGLAKEFPVRRGPKRAHVTAVDAVSFEVAPGESLGIAGESGSGKTTVARMIVGLETPTAGQIWVCGRERSAPARRPRERRQRGREAQMVFQNPYSSLDPRQTIGACLDEVLRLHFSLDKDERRERVAELLGQVGLDEAKLRARPVALSGGERQRVAIARALATEPEVLLLDEAVAALDVSIQAQILNLLAEVRRQRPIAFVFISHDLAVMRQVTDSLVVMRDGRIVERGRTAAVLDDPQDPYTQLLRNSVPRPGWKPRRRSSIDPEGNGKAAPAWATDKT